jgi:hypothetical protein
MFKPYDPDEVPDIMPFPELATVKTTKGEQIAVPKLNKHQRSWILDIGVRDHDLASLNKKDALQVYEEIMLDAFEAKAFQHTPQPQDRDEESRLPGLVVAWKKQNQRAKKNTDSGDDSDGSDQEEDEGGHVALLRGYAKAGWHRVSTGAIDLSGFERAFDIHQYRRSRRLSATSGRRKFGKGRPRRRAKVGNPLPRPLLWGSSLGSPPTPVATNSRPIATTRYRNIRRL